MEVFFSQFTGFHRPFRTDDFADGDQTLRVWLISTRRSATETCAALVDPALRLVTPTAIRLDE
jgi:hypothetical protein